MALVACIASAAKDAESIFFKRGNIYKDIKYYIKQGSINSIRRDTGPASGSANQVGGSLAKFPGQFPFNNTNLTTISRRQFPERLTS